MHKAVLFINNFNEKDLLIKVIISKKYQTLILGITDVLLLLKITRSNICKSLHKKRLYYNFKDLCQYVYNIQSNF